MDEIIAACMNYEGALGEIDDFPISPEPVWILGREYSTEKELESLREDVESRIWLTYRKNFSVIGDTSYTTDKGWGCMLRCGQMVLAEALLRIHLGRGWRWDVKTKDDLYLRIVSLFEDTMEKCYSLHNIAMQGVAEGKDIGEWYGPNTVAQVIKKVVKLDKWNHLSINVVMDNIFIIDEIRESCQIADKTWQPLILFIPLRLGLTDINSIYILGLKKCLKMPQCIGVIGGKPNHALFLIGFMGEEVVFLDPHTTQEAGVFGRKECIQEEEMDTTLHCTRPQRMPFQYLDPSLAMCFVCDTEKEFDDLCNRLQHQIMDSQKTPLLEICPTRPFYMKHETSEPVDGATCIELNEDHLESDYDDEEFEVLE